MGTQELADALGCSKGLVSQLAKRGMPTTNPQAAQAWREANAKPRKWKAKSATPSPITPRSKSAPAASSKPPSAPASPATEAADDPAESLRRARSTERASFRKLELLQKDKLSTIEDVRKGAQVYFNARNNRARAEADHRDFLRAEQVTLFYDEAVDIAGRPHLAARNMLANGGKELAVRCHGQSQRQIESTITAWLDRLAQTIHSAI